MEATIEIDDLKGNMGKKKTKEVPGYPGLWTFIFGILYFALAGFTSYSSYILYDQFVNQDLPKDTQPTLEDSSVMYFSLTMAIAINSFICSYLFFIKEVTNYKILLFNCILGLVSFVVFTPYILALKENSSNKVIYPLVSASLGLFLSGIITVKMLWKNIPYYE